jgi:DNA polymerase-1
MADAPRKMFLIDGSNHAFRVFFALPRMTADGFPTGALLGFANMLKNLEEVHQPDYIVVVFDKGASFRMDLYPEYKGHRPEMDPELRAQWPHFDELVEAWGYKSLSMPGFEADDIIATMARRWAGPELQVFLVSGDKDFYQLVNDHVSILDLMKNRTFSYEGVQEKFGVGPDRVIDVQALAGDSSDNVPGVTGIGIKTAAKLINAYGSLDELLERADEIKGKRGENLRNERELALLSRTLVTLVTDVPLDLTLSDLEEHPRDVSKLKELFVKWQFRSHLKTLEQGAEPPPPSVDRSRYRCLRTVAQLTAAVASIRQVGQVAFDLETTSLDTLQAEIVGFCLCWSDDDAVYVPVGHNDPGPEGQLSEAQAMAILGPVLADPAIAKLGQNLKYDHAVMTNRGYALLGIASDTMLADYLLEPDRSKHGLNDLALRYLGHDMIKFDDLIDQVPQQDLFAGNSGEVRTFADVSIERATEYGAEDAHVAWLLHGKLIPRLAECGLEDVYRTIEVPLLSVLSKMESAGIGVDIALLKEYAVELNARLIEAQADCYGIVGRKFKINSPKQLRVILFEELGLKPIRRTKTGPSTDADTLEKLKDLHPLPMAILRYRALAKLKSTYVDPLPGFASPVDGRIHTSFHQAVAATGRLSSNNPNLQNIPIRTEDGKRIRECFVAREGHVFLSCDYSQVELRILAHYCQEGPLVEAFNAGQDIHRRTASEVFEIPMDQVTSEQRSASKAINFGIVYGMSAFRLSNELGISRSTAQAYIDGYFERYSGVARVIEDFKKQATETGHATTLWGRKRRIRNIKSKNQRDLWAAERLAVNTPIQGSAADLIKRAMLAVNRRLESEYPRSKLLLQVHDELLLEVPVDELDGVRTLVIAEMEAAGDLRVPLKVDAGHGRTWAQAH